MNVSDAISLVDLGTSTVEIDSKCAKCTESICCNSINQRIDAPRSIQDFDHLLWQVSHRNINVFKDAEGWFLHIYANCEHLGDGGVCGIYDKRPFICRDYTNDFCEFDEPIPKASELFFSSYKDLDNYCRKRFKNWDNRFERHGR
ncbi:MAG: hypothetical protein WDZ76_03370 [Pseudohongiellaceae bacterium]